MSNIGSKSHGRKSARRFATMFLTVGILGLGSSGVLASPSLGGSTGLINVPSADTVPQNELSVGFHFTDSRGQASLTYGLLPNLELGVAAIDRQKPKYGTELYPFVKGQLIRESRTEPGVAVGYEQGGSAYVAISRALDGGTRLHGGLGTGRFGGLFGGIEHTLNSVTVTRPGASRPPVTRLIGEYDGRGINVGVRLSLSPQFELQGGLLDVGGSSSVIIGASFSTRL